ncbi:hypothetical protein E1A91_D11G115000v1 [Gossypium mustelinum]|uniref:Protein kinase domain-containing protein n=1 Tax=Gossypium mustelinum TaxID=34275 RepID=A0A5D2SST5_GOSMU|nr:hypothetical protein E1A91_D11G115000v1 [Gossypium mustelinum]
MMTTRVDYGGPGPGQVRLVGDYILGPRIGSGSFAVVWRSRHRQHGLEVAVKEIDKKLLSSKVSESLLKEISILSTINHPNIIQLFEAIETEDRIFLVLEYCDGGDLAAYIQRYGKVSEEVARHLMRQLAAGLQVLQEKHLIHRDLKPQNLLLTKGSTPQLKIGDFGFARSLTPENLADTLCGSPLYMAPEIIQNKKYDAKADLWSVGAILFQLVTGKPPFDGNNQLQLFQNILRSTELQFPEGALEKLHPDCVNLCRSLLRHDPVERLTFREFFDHKFLGERSKKVGLELDSSRLQSEAMVEQFDSSASENKSPLPYRDVIDISSINQKSASSFGCGTVSQTKEYECSSSVKGALGAVALTVCDSKGKSVDNQCSPAQLRADSLEGIEKEYVLVNSHSTSMETFSYYLETSLQDYSTLKCQAKKSDQEPAVSLEKETAESSAASAKSPQFQGLDMQTSSESAMLREVQRLNVLHPSTRLQLLHQYARAIAEIAQGKYNAGLFVESFSVELVVLAIWKKALQICSSWKTSAPDNESPGSNSGNQPTTTIQSSADLAPNSGDNVDLNKPSSACIWAEQGFIVAYDRAEKLSCHLQDMDAQMPDAMEIIYQTALTIGTNGAVDEYMRNKGSAAALYSKAMVLLSFIVGEAASLPLNPPFSLTPANKKRIQAYINNLQTHQSQFLTSAPFPKLSADFHTK